jgi:hypothetical protein
MLDGLTDSERRRLVEAAEQRQNSDPAQWPKDRVARMPGTETNYVMLVPPDLHVFFNAPEGNGIEILDIVREGLLRFLRGERRAKGAEG